MKKIWNLASQQTSLKQSKKSLKFPKKWAVKDPNSRRKLRRKRYLHNLLFRKVYHRTSNKGNNYKDAPHFFTLATPLSRLGQKLRTNHRRKNPGRRVSRRNAVLKKAQRR
jgi:hypothetical protein